MGTEAEDISIQGVVSDSSLLIAGPPMTGKYELMLRLLDRYAESLIVISTKSRASKVREDVRAIAGDVPDDHVRVIDCVSHHESVDDVEATDTTMYVNSPGNLTGIGVTFTDMSESVYEGSDVGHVGVGLHSVSQLLMHAPMKQVYQFMQVLIGQVRSAGWFGVSVVDTTTADDEQLGMLQHHFDGVVETRENDAGRREFRIRGLAPETSDWRPF